MKYAKTKLKIGNMPRNHLEFRPGLPALCDAGGLKCGGWRRWQKSIFIFVWVYILVLFLPLYGASSNTLSPEEAYEILMEGNLRFISDESKHFERTEERRLETAENQEPFAVIVGCSDSRVSPEIIFDQGIGDLFIVRLAGNVVGPLALDSIEYSTLYLHSSLVMVLGHQNCGAVTAVLNGTTKNIESIAKKIAPAIRKCKKDEGDPLVNAIKCNVQHVVKQLKDSSVLKKLIKEGKLKIVGGYYNFQTGDVTILDTINQN